MFGLKLSRLIVMCRLQLAPAPVVTLSPPPLYLVPGKRLNRDVMDAATEVSGSAVTVALKGFMKSSIFVKWLEHFEDSVPLRVKRPLILIYDGLGSHHNNEFVAKVIELKIILVLLPANRTHLV